MVIVERFVFGSSATFADVHNIGAVTHANMSSLESCLLTVCEGGYDLDTRSGCVYVLGRLRDSKFKKLFVRTLQETVEKDDPVAMFQVMTALADIGDKIFTRSQVSIVDEAENRDDALRYLCLQGGG